MTSGSLRSSLLGGERLQKFLIGLTVLLLPLLQASSILFRSFTGLIDIWFLSGSQEIFPGIGSILHRFGSLGLGSKILLLHEFLDEKNHSISRTLGMTGFSTELAKSIQSTVLLAFLPQLATLSELDSLFDFRELVESSQSIIRDLFRLSNVHLEEVLCITNRTISYLLLGFIKRLPKIS